MSTEPGYVVRIERSDRSPAEVIGTGVVVGARAVLTCCHVVEGVDPDVPLTIVTKEGGSERVIDVDDRSRSADLALLRLRNDLPVKAARFLNELTEAKIGAAGGHKIVAFGYPGGVAIEHAPLRPGDLRANFGADGLTKSLYGLGPLLPHGLSGGPLTVTIDREAYVLGLNRRGGNSPAFQAVPADDLIQFLTERGVAAEIAPMWTSLSPARNAEVKSLLSQRRSKKANGDKEAVKRIDNEIRQISGGLDAIQPEAVFASRFRLLRRIGTGGMSSVWLAEDFESEERPRVALKILRSDTAQQAALREKFDRGSEVLNEFQHPSIVRLVESPSDHDGFRYYAMEYIDAPSLAELPSVASNSGSAQEELIAVLTNIASALDHLHEQGAVHRDVTPANILVRRDGEGRSEGILVDFDTILTETSKQLTVLGAGTQGYVAPEVRSDPNQASSRSDQYALAKCVLAAFGQFADEHRSIAEAVASVPISERAREVLRRALSKEPTQRWDAVGEFVDEFRRCWGKDPGPGPRPIPQVFKVLGIIACLVIAIVAYRIVTTASGGTHEADNQTTKTPALSVPPGLSLQRTNAQGFKEYLHDKSGLTLILIPGGTFTMGSEDLDADPDEQPLTEVTLSPYFLAKDEVTWGQYRRFCQTTGLAMPDAPSWGIQDDHPVVNVSWTETKAYCDWAGLTLPTEAEWEYAARGSEGRKWPWGEEEPTPGSSHARMKDMGFGTAPVGVFSKGLGPFGHRDLAGNALEWCSSWWQHNHPGGLVSNPHGPVSGSSRVYRGGCWVDAARSLRGSCRFRYLPSQRYRNLGFRPSLAS